MLEQLLELKTEEERRAFVEGLSQIERLQLWGDAFQAVHQACVGVLIPVFAEFRAAIERFAEACENSGIDLTQLGGDHE